MWVKKRQKWNQIHADKHLQKEKPKQNVWWLNFRGHFNTQLVAKVKCEPRLRRHHPTAEINANKKQNTPVTTCAAHFFGSDSEEGHATFRPISWPQHKHKQKQKQKQPTTTNNQQPTTTTTTTTTTTPATTTTTTTTTTITTITTTITTTTTTIVTTTATTSTTTTTTITITTTNANHFYAGQGSFNTANSVKLMKKRKTKTHCNEMNFTSICKCFSR